MECPSCGNAMGETAVYCGHCGTPLRRRCHICDANNALDAQSCQECGRTLRTQSAPESGAELSSVSTEGDSNSGVSQPEASACPRCHTLNPTSAQYCDACGLPFDEEVSARPERTAGFFIRLGAFLLDAFIVFFAASLILGLLGVNAEDGITSRDLFVLLVIEAA